MQEPTYNPITFEEVEGGLMVETDQGPAHLQCANAEDEAHAIDRYWGIDRQTPPEFYD